MVSVLHREVKRGVGGAGCEIWAARCDLREVVVMGHSLSSSMLVHGFPHYSYLSFSLSFCTGSFVLQIGPATWISR